MSLRKYLGLYDTLMRDSSAMIDDGVYHNDDECNTWRPHAAMTTT